MAGVNPLNLLQSMGFGTPAAAGAPSASHLPEPKGTRSAAAAPKAAEPEAAGEFPMMAPNADGDKTGARADDSELEASEESAAQRLRDKAGSGKRASRMPRPAASTSAAMKRPAAAAADPPPMKKAKKQKKGGVTESDLPRGFKLNLKEFLCKKVAAKYPSKGACTSKLYSEGGKQATAKKLSVDDVKLAQKVAYSIGSYFWVNSGL